MGEPDWSDLKVLLSLSSGGSVAGAARELGVDASTVSRRLAALEESLGVTLILRGGQRFQWTPEGRTMLAAAETIRAEVARASGLVQAAQADLSLGVVVSCPSGISSAILGCMVGVRARYPDLRIEIAAENRTVDLAKGEADIALRMFRPEDPSLVCRTAFGLGWAAYASRGYIEACGRPATPQGLEKHRLVRYVRALHKVVGPRWLEDHAGGSPSALFVDNTEVATTAVAAGRGIGVIPCPLGDAHPELTRVFDDPVGEAPGFLVYHEALREKACVRRAVDVLVEMFTENKSLFSGRS